MILVTGGAGYIGSHTVIELLIAGYRCVVLDNLSNSSVSWVDRVEKITGRKVCFLNGDLRDSELLRNLFRHHSFHAVIHFAGLKSVADSVVQPIAYYDNNVGGTLALIEAMQASGVRKIIFSSSASVYGEPKYLPIDEMHPTAPNNPYSRSKWMVEQVLTDLAAADREWRIATLRYFNPVGAHPSGLNGEDINRPSQSLVSVLWQVTRGSIGALPVFGNDYCTSDGTCMRDFIHVQDLARGHISALRALDTKRGAFVWNLGTGRSHSVLEVVRAFEAASGRSIPYFFERRRSGDVSIGHADPAKAERELGWIATRNLSDMMRDTWRWYSRSL